MKKRILLASFLPVLLILLVISCKSTPPAAEPEPPPVTQPLPPPPTGAGQAALNALQAAMDKATEARKRAMDFESPAYFPSDWNAAEQRYNAANNMHKLTDAEAAAATIAFNSATVAYNDLFEKTIPLYAQAREDEIMAARNTLIATGLTGEYPEYLNFVDGTALKALELYEAKDYYGAKDTAAKALYEYESLIAAAGIYRTREEILERRFDSYDPGNFEKADEVALAAIYAAEAGNYGAAETYGEEAMLRYNLVLSNGWVAFASDRRNYAHNERQKALNLRANIAVRELFRDAEAQYTQAENALKAARYDTAASLYMDSEAKFVIASRDAEERRRRADQAIRQAEGRIEQSDNKARDAEIIIEGGR